MAEVAPLILAIEDDEALCAVYNALFVEEGYRCQAWSGDPAAGVAEVIRVEPDLVILDLVFRGEATGGTLLTALHDAAATAAIPILIVTAADALAKEWASTIEAWGCGLLRKPFDLDELIAAVRTCLGDDTRRIAS